MFFYQLDFSLSQSPSAADAENFGRHNNLFLERLVFHSGRTIGRRKAAAMELPIYIVTREYSWHSKPFPPPTHCSISCYKTNIHRKPLVLGLLIFNEELQ